MTSHCGQTELNVDVGCGKEALGARTRTVHSRSRGCDDKMRLSMREGGLLERSEIRDPRKLMLVCLCRADPL